MITPNKLTAIIRKTNLELTGNETLRSTIPMSIVRQWKLKDGDKLDTNNYSNQ
jgi:hypothetical protein